MNKLSVAEVLKGIRNTTILPHNIYDFDISYDTKFATDHYLKNPTDNIDIVQPLSKAFVDIEVYMEHKDEPINEWISTGKYKINALTTYSDIDDIYHVFFVPYDFKNMPSNKTIKKHIYEESIKEGHIKKDQKIEVYLFKKSIDMMIAYWKLIRKQDPCVLSGFNSDVFDYPYIYHFLLKHLGSKKKVAKLMSRFGSVKLDNGKDRAGRPINYLKIADYPICDLLYYYRPRSEGGLNLGKLQANYSLNNISEQELGIKKLEYAQSGMTLDNFYIKDPLNFLLYNVWDVVLCVKLDEKLAMIDQYNMIRRAMKTSISAALRGSSPLFDSFVYHKLQSEGSYVRYGINDESDVIISANEIKNIPIPKGKVKWEGIEEIGIRDYKRIINKFPGAYVKQPKPIITDASNSFVSDLDAKSLYPSMMNQFNLSFDTFFGKILPSYINKTIDFLKSFLGTGEVRIPQKVIPIILDRSKDYIKNRASVQNMNKAIQETYYTIYTLLERLRKYNKSFDVLINPVSYKDYMMFRTYLIPFIELMSEINIDAKEYNDYMYKYIINNEELDGEKLWIIQNMNNPTMNMVSIDGGDIRKYIKKHQLGLTITGSLFYTHEYKIGLFNKFLDDTYILREKYKYERDSHPEGNILYKDFDRRQFTMKVLMNTTYGLMGMSSYRYSNKNIASTITIQGRLALKTSQYFGEKYLKNKYGKV